MKNLIHRLITEDDGATMVEYALMVGLIAVAVIGAVTTLGTNLSAKFTSLAGQVTAAGGGS